jgi:peptide deformylase
MARQILTETAKLQQKCEDVSINEAFEIIDELNEALDLQKGIGLAANQIGIYKKVCIVRVPNESGRGEKHVFGHNFANPKIISRQNPIIFDNEGCLSFPNSFIKTLRYLNIEVLDLLHPEGRVFSGMEAICVQHEVDHTLSKTMYESTLSIIGRNGKCPCESGKKFKKCCMLILRKEGSF